MKATSQKKLQYDVEPNLGKYVDLLHLWYLGRGPEELGDAAPSESRPTFNANGSQTPSLTILHVSVTASCLLYSFERIGGFCLEV